MKKRKVALVGRNMNFLKGLKKTIENENTIVDVKDSMIEATLSCVEEEIDMILVDNGFSGNNSMRFLYRMKRIRPHLKSMILVGNTDEETEKDAIEKGVDVVLSTDKSQDVMLGYVSKLLNDIKKEKESEDSQIISGVEFDLANNKITIAGREIAVTLKEYKLIMLLVKNSDRPLSREYIRDKVWSSKFEEVNLRAIDGYIKRLRKKIGGQYITTVRGYGYCWGSEE